MQLRKYVKWTQKKRIYTLKTDLRKTLIYKDDFSNY
jgi:hypothetical protein